MMMMKHFTATVLLSLLSIGPVYPSCFNDPRFKYFYAGKNRGCQNIRIDNFRREEMCGRFEEVRNGCPQACGTCCVDREDYRFRTRRNSPIEVPCSYVANNPERQAKYCRKWSAGMMIRDACPFSCDFCQPAVLERPPTPAPKLVTSPPTKAPTKNPTPAPTAAPTKAPTVSPTKPPTKTPTARPTFPPRTGDPTKAPTKAPTANPTKSPTKPPTPSPTLSSNAPTYVCEDDPNYRVNNNDNLSCEVLGNDEQKRQRFCVNKKTETACPRTCGICCSDDRSYQFKTYLKTDKRCGWVAEEKIRQNRYCEKVRSGRLVKLACPKTCDFCFNPVGADGAPRGGGYWDV